MEQNKTQKAENTQRKNSSDQNGRSRDKTKKQ